MRLHGLAVPHSQWPVRARDSGLPVGTGRQMVTLPAGERQVPVRQAGLGGAPARPSGVVVLPGRGLHLPQELPFDSWLRVGAQLAKIASSSAWCLGDWLIYGQVAYKGRYREAVERTSLDYQTLRNYAWVARRFSLSRRRDSLSFAHHAEVAALAEVEQEFWLRKALELGWPVKQLRQQVRTSHSQRSVADGTGDGKRLEQIPGNDLDDQPDAALRSTVQLRVHITPEQLETYGAAAAKDDSTVEQWAVLALDRAALRAGNSSALPAPALQVNNGWRWRQMHREQE